MNIKLTPAAHKFIRRLVQIDGGRTSGLRMLVSTGGCAGLAAEFSVEPGPRDNEAVFTQDAVKLFLPTESRLLLDGVTIDFVDTPAKTGFVFLDPKKTTCASSSSDTSAFAESLLTTK